MRSSSRFLVACLVCGVLGLTVWSVAAQAQETSLSTGSSSLFEGSLMVPASESLLGGEQQQAERAVQLASPEAAREREESETAYEGLSASAAMELADRVFPKLINEPNGGPPTLPEGERISKIVGVNAAQVSLSSGGHGVLESLEPMGTRSASGEWVPIDLSLEESSDGFQPKTPAAGVRVRIPWRLGEGASLSDSGISLTPVDEHGSPLEGARGAIDGASVFYGGSENTNAGIMDVDTLLKPDTSGFSEETLLRSQRSPQKLFYGVGVPQGASLTQTNGGAVEILVGGRVIAEVPVPSARDAEGTPVPVSAGLSGDVLALTVDHRPGQYRMPIVVDPSLRDESLTTSGVNKTNWHYVTSSGAEHFKATENTSEKKWTIKIDGMHTETESGGLWYTTQGLSSIKEFSVELIGETTGSHVENLLELVKPPGVREGSPAPLGEKWTGGSWGLCGKCFEEPYKMGATNNSAVFQQQSIKAGGGIGGEVTLTKASVFVEQEKGAEMSFDKTDTTVDGGRTNVLYGSGGWLGPNSGAFEIDAKDPGIGVSWVGITSGSWGQTFPIYENGECTGGIQCPPAVDKGWTYSNKWPDGEDTFEANACDAAELPAQCSHATQKIKVDGTAPHNIVLTGLPSGNEIGSGEYHLKAEATDGSGTIPSSGIKSLTLYIDGRETGTPSGSCSVPTGPCTAHAEWTIAGRNYAAGKHVITVIATDNAANFEGETYAVTVHTGSPVALGPGSVNPQSGEYTLTATDASFGSGLTVTRSYNSRHVGAGAQGSFGTPWALGMGGQESLIKQTNGSMVFTDSAGAQTIFATDNKGGFTSPTGDSNLTLSSTPCETGKTEYRLKNSSANTSTCFAVPSGGTGEEWTPSVVIGAVAANTSIYQYETVEISGKKLTRPKEALAPVPAGVTCSLAVKPTEMKHGCRALTFNYATSTTATGEASEQWGDYVGHMTRVYYTAYDPVTKTMHEIAVAHYLYDTQGRLRAESDPRVSPELKTVYGYDSEGHVTALTPPGQESWGFVYGSIGGDVSSGRVLKVGRGTASTPLWEKEAPKNVEAPKIAGSPSVGARLAVSNGRWLGSPVVYGYQWEDCSVSGEECSAIAGATNPNYTPSDTDMFHTLVAVVTATNGGGSTTASGRVLLSAGTITETSLPSGSHPVATVTGPDDNVWFTDEGTSKIGKMTTSGTVTEYALPAGSNPYGITSGPDGNVWFSEKGTGKIGKITTSGSVTEYELPAGSKPYGIVSGLDGNLWFANYGTGKVGRITTSGTVTEWYGSAGGHPYGITVGPDGNLWVTEPGSNTINKVATSGIMTVYNLPAGSSPGQITSGPDGKLWFTDTGTNKVSKIATSGTITEYSLPTGSSPSGIMSGSDGNLWFTDNGTSRLGRITTAGIVSETPLPAGSLPDWIAAGPDANPWFADYETGKVAKIAISGVTAMHEFTVPFGSKPFDITVGPDRNLWFTNSQTNKIGKSTPSGSITEYALPESSKPFGIAPGPDGNLWFAENGTNKIGKITTSGAVTEYALTAGSSPYGITAGPDGNLWFTEPGTNKIGKITTSGTITQYALPAGSAPNSITTGPDANLWFTDKGSSKIGKITTSGTVSEYALPGSSEPYGITAGSDKKLWFVNYGTSKIGQITTTGSVTEYALSSGSHPARIVAGSDGNLWFTEESANKLAKITVSGKITEYTGPSGSKPFGITSGLEGNIWYTGSEVDKLGSLTTTRNEYAPSEYALSAGSDPQEIVLGADGNLWSADYGGSVAKITSSGVVTEYPVSVGRAAGITSGPDGNLWFTNSATSKIEKLTPSGTITEVGSLPVASTPEAITTGPDGDLWFLDTGSRKVGKMTLGGTVTEYALAATPGDIVSGPDGNLWLTLYSSNKVAKITTSGTITEYALPGGSGPEGITAGPDGNLWVTNITSNKIAKISTSGTVLGEYTLPSGSNPFHVTAGADGNLWFTDILSNMIGKITTSGQVTEYTVPGENRPAGITTGPDGNMWFTEYASGKIGKASVTAPEAEVRQPAPGSTVEYNVPLEGTGLPTMTPAEVKAKWGQEDAPAEAAAIFPPDEPQSWPASDYRRATISYFDTQGHTVNVATPSGGISTSEYNATNDVTRTLSADNLMTALKEGAKSVEVAKLLDTRSKYDSEGTELTETLGPRHLVKLPNGKEVQARSHTVYSYDEGAPTEGGPYRLVTKTTQGAQIEGEAEQDVRTTTTSYAGEGNLGWAIRRPTSVTADPTGLKLTHTTVYDPNTGEVLETRKPAGASTPTYVSQFGADRGGHGKFNWPEGIAIDTKGNIWVADTYNDRVQQFSASGEYLNQFGSWGTGNGQMEYPKSIAVDGKGNVWIVDSGADRIEEFSETGAYITKFGSEGTGNGQLKSPEGLAIDSKGNVWVTDTGNNRVQEFTEAGVYVTQFGSEGTGNGQFKSPRRIAVDSKGNLWVSDGANNRVQEFSETGTYVAQFGSAGSGNGQFSDPQGISVDSSGNVWVVDENNNRVQEINEKHEYVGQFGTKGAGNGQLQEPEGLALDSKGNVWVIDSGNSRAEQFSATGSYMAQFGAHGTPLGSLYDPKGVAVDPQGNAWVADTNKARIVKFSPTGEPVAAYGTEGSGPGQFKAPRGIAIDAKGNVWVIDQTNDRVEEYDETGKYVREFGSVGSGNGQLKEPQGIAVDKEGNIWVADTGNFRIEEFSGTGTYLSKFGVEGTGNGQLKEPKNLVIDANGNIWVSDSWTSRVTEFTSTGTYIGQLGTYGSGAGQLHQAQGLAIDQAGNIWVADASNNRIEEFTAKGSYLGQFGTEGSGNGQMAEPRGITFDSDGHAWIADTNNNRIEKWTIATPRATQTIYYSTEANPGAPACGGHPEWAMLPCETLPGKQPETPGLPALPVNTVTSYNMWLEPLTASSTSGSATRTNTNTYDEAGRLETNETTSTVGTALPKVTNKYDGKTGALIEQSTTVEAKTQSLKSLFNTLGQMTSYSDADGNTATFEYETEMDGRLKKVNDGKGVQTYEYDTTTGAISELTDSAAGKFVPGYDIEGNITSETYPNGLKAIYGYDSAGNTTSLLYKKETHCTENCEWFKENVVPSIHGQWLSHTSSLGKQSYVYDQVGRLTEAQVTPTGKGCTTRRYAYDEDTNRTSLTTYPPNSKGECSTESPVVENHSYDEADRLTDTGVGYDAYGNTAGLPAADAGGFSLTSGFYVDNQLQSQAQHEQTIGYQLDPAHRTREIVSTGKVVASEIQHYAGPGNTPAWTGELSGNWTREISGFSGLDAIQHNGETPVLQLSNLHGDIVATAADSETASGLASTINEASEYGVPATEAPPKYSWLGAHEIRTELPSGVTGMGARSYVPQLGRFLQSDPIPGGSANPYAYTNGNPINETDLTGMYVEGNYAVGYENEGHERAAEAEAAREAAARAEAEARAAQAAREAAIFASIEAEGPEEEWWEEEGEEEGEYEYVSSHQSGPNGRGDHSEPVVLVEPLLRNEEAGRNEAPTTTTNFPVLSLCKAGSSGPCTRDTGGAAPGGGCARSKKCLNHFKKPPAHKGKPKRPKEKREKAGWQSCETRPIEAGFDLPPTKKECEEFKDGLNGEVPLVPPAWGA